MSTKHQKIMIMCHISGEWNVANDKVFLERQRHVLQLFYRVNQHDWRHPEYVEIDKTFSVQVHADSFSVRINIFDDDFICHFI